MLFITLERYYVICKPLKVKAIMTQSHTLKIIVFIWVISIIMNLPWIYLTGHFLQFFNDSGKLEYRCGTNQSLSQSNLTFVYMILTTFIFYALIGIILVFLYYKISKNLKNSNKFLTKSTRKTSGQLLREVKSSNVDSNYNQDDEMPLKDIKANPKARLNMIKSDYRVNKSEIESKVIKNRKKLIGMIMWVIVCFYVCLTPIKAWNLGKFKRKQILFNV